MRSTNRTGLVLAALAAAVFIAFPLGTAHADMIGSAPVESSTGDAGAQLATQLSGAGLSGAEVAGRMAQFQPQDVEVLEQNPAQLQLAGDGGTTIAIIAGSLLLLALILYLILKEPM